MQLEHIEKKKERKEMLKNKTPKHMHVARKKKKIKERRGREEERSVEVEAYLEVLDGGAGTAVVSSSQWHSR